ncbi:MAG: hypothetical protein M0P19_15275 [Nevskia sp.]|jgi:hypothetical protein|nr:hypothetical protein [Nevskia sp.]MCK9383369.1 hypothetical protein [Nevskia sp.]
MIKFYKNFECDYSIDVLSEIPSGVRAFCFPGAVEGGYVEGVTVSIIPRADSNQSWIGTFANGQLSPRAVSYVGACPDPEQLCVIAKGDGYIVNVVRPAEYVEVPIMPIMGVTISQEHELLLMHSFDRVIAWGKSGLSWKTQPISFDGVRFLGINGDILRVEVLDVPAKRTVIASIDLKSGSTEGGAR